MKGRKKERKKGRNDIHILMKTIVFSSDIDIVCTVFHIDIFSLSCIYILFCTGHQ